MLVVDIQKRIGTIDLTVRFEHRAGILILFGPSGAGKTTTLRVIAGMDRPDSGEIALDGRTMFCGRRGINAAVQSRRFGFIFQHHNLFPHMTVRQNIAYAANDAAPIAHWLDRFNVGHLADRYPARLSGGEKQRVALIRSLAAQPRLLLLDEPMSSVDVATRQVLMEELRAVQRDTGVPMIYVTHEIAEAYRLGDRVLVLDRGRVIHDGVPIDVLQTPTSSSLAGLSGAENIIRGVVDAHHPDDDTTDLRVDGVVLHVPHCSTAVGSPAVVAVRPEDILIARHAVTETSARNQLRGVVVGIQQDRLPLVRVKIENGPTLRARVTRRSIASLELNQGATVYLVIKAWAFHVVDDEITHDPSPLK
ncbi:MAG: molybdenum ABC transporter ATP-binding protein [Phycisphaerales bacterium]|nr:molybdenum ABC transporter ATP-binding protein [Phycisphaerales bacterium]